MEENDHNRQKFCKIEKDAETFFIPDKKIESKKSKQRYLIYNISSQESGGKKNKEENENCNGCYFNSCFGD